MNSLMQLLYSFQNGWMEIEKQYIDFYLAQVSINFITISVISVLSDKSVIIYWEDIVKKTLISPPILNFRFLMKFTYFLMAISTVFMLGQMVDMFFVAFILNVVILAFLSLRMADIYFNPRKKKESLEKEYLKWVKADKKENIGNMKTKLHMNTLKAFDNNDLTVIEDNCEFYSRHSELLSGVDVRFFVNHINQDTILPISLLLVSIYSNREDITMVDRIEYEDEEGRLVEDFYTQNIEDYLLTIFKNKERFDDVWGENSESFYIFLKKLYEVLKLKIDEERVSLDESGAVSGSVIMGYYEAVFHYFGSRKSIDDTIEAVRLFNESGIKLYYNYYFDAEQEVKRIQDIRQILDDPHIYEAEAAKVILDEFLQNVDYTKNTAE